MSRNSARGATPPARHLEPGVAELQVLQVAGALQLLRLQLLQGSQTAAVQLQQLVHVVQHRHRPQIAAAAQLIAHGWEAQ